MVFLLSNLHYDIIDFTCLTMEFIQRIVIFFSFIALMVSDIMVLLESNKNRISRFYVPLIPFMGDLLKFKLLLIIDYSFSNLSWEDVYQ